MTNRYINKPTYFTRVEAETAKAFLIKFIGREMFYAFHKDPARVVDVEVRPTDIEIVNYGEIEEGFLIFIHFQEIVIESVLFCSLNALPPVYAKHPALQQAEKQQLITNKYIRGDWAYESGDDFLRISIKENSVTVEGNIKGSPENKSFATGGHWFQAFVYGFLSNPDYIVFSANETELGFGKLETPRMINGKYKWQVKLKRTA